jgi:hypothetical protein
MAKGPPDLAVLFARRRNGAGDALSRIMDALYAELRALAARWTFARAWLKTQLKPAAAA